MLLELAWRSSSCTIGILDRLIMATLNNGFASSTDDELLDVYEAAANIEYWPDCLKKSALKI